MRLWLAWRFDDTDVALSTDAVVANLHRMFDVLWKKPPDVRVFRSGDAAFVSFELPWVGWTPPFVQEDQQTAALAADYPMNAVTVLRRQGWIADGSPVLPVLCRDLEREPSGLLEELAPPFSAVWLSKDTGEVFVQNDGLGQSQVFEYQDSRLWAASNKINALGALGVRLEPVPLEWAMWATLGWFPLLMTGYKGVRVLEPGTQIRLGADGIVRARHDVLSRWVTPTEVSASHCLELARASLFDHISAALPLLEQPEVSLTAGWDSRAVVSSLRAAGAKFSLTVRGTPGRPDVEIARKLARIAGLELGVQTSSGLPPEDVASCRRSILHALLWQAGHAAPHRHKTFLAHRDHLKLRAPSITGQHGEIARRERALFTDEQARTLRSGELSEAQYEDFTLAALLEEAPRFLRADLRAAVREVIDEAYHAGDRYGLSGLRRVDFFCLHEFTRRKGGALHAGQTRALVAPFLNPGFIRGVFGYPARRGSNALHRYIIEANSPDWVGVPFHEDIEAPASPAEAGPGGWNHPVGRENYDGTLYWAAVGEPLVDEALRNGGFWTAIFDPDLAARDWAQRPDLIPILYLLDTTLN